MAVSDWWMLVSFYQNVLAIPFAFVALVLVIRAKTRRRRVSYAALIPVLLLPNLQVYAGNLYFDYLCRTQAGEFIYRTVDNVEGILQMRPRDGSKDYFDRMRAGDIPEDPWGHTNWEAQSPQTMFVNPPWANYLFFETVLPKDRSTFPGERVVARKGAEERDARYRRYFGYDQARNLPMRVDYVRNRLSRFGFTWEQETSLINEVLSIYVGEIRVVDLESNEVLARTIGIYRSRPARLCPSGKEDNLVFKFVSQVLKPPVGPQESVELR